MTGILVVCLLLAGFTAGHAQNGPSPPASPAREMGSGSQPALANADSAVSSSIVAGETRAEPTPASPAANSPSRTVRLSPWANEIAKLVRAGIEDSVLLSFIDSSGTFNLGADQIIHLKDVGVSGEVLSAMLQHDQDLASGARILTTSTSPPMDPELEGILARVREASSKTDSAAAARPLTESAAKETPAEAEWFVYSPAASPLGADPEPASESLATKDVAASLFTAAAPALQAAPAKRHSGAYRVPETRSVELLPPIIVLKSANPPPNVIIIDMFPSSR